MPAPVAAILWQRGLGDPGVAGRFLSPALATLPDPSQMAGLDDAVALLGEALLAEELIALHGDYDADGMTSTALVARFLAAAGAGCVPYLPCRHQDGYGLSEQGVRHAAAAGAQVLVALDCGTSDHASVALAKTLGLRVVVVDHHPVAAGLPPDAVAVLNPSRADCAFAEGVLSAVGVAFFLVVGLRRWLRQRGFWSPERPEPNLRHFLDVVALGTVADVVPLRGANRTLVRHGLQVLGRSRLPGIVALCQQTGLGGTVTAWDVAFRLAPRLNAAGRVGRAADGFELLRTSDPATAARLACLLEKQNAERKDLQRAVERAALAQIEASGQERDPVLVVAGEGWHPGVVGIVASRLVDRYHVPAVVIAVEGEVGRGSARSVPGVDIGTAVRGCAAHLMRGGGHPGAAGVTLLSECVEPFRAALAERVLEQLSGGVPIPELLWDAEVRLADVDDALVAALGRLAPFGEANPEPVLVARGLRLQRRRVLKGEHLRCELAQGRASLPAMGFGLAQGAPEEGATVRAAFRARYNDFRGVRTLRLELEDLRET